MEVSGNNMREEHGRDILTREEKINDLVSHIKEWDHDDLVAYIQEGYRDELSLMDKEMLSDEWEDCFGVIL